MRTSLVDLRTGRPVTGSGRRRLLAPVVALVLAATAGSWAGLPAQETQVPDVVSKMLSVAPADQGKLALANGIVRMDGQELGQYTPGGPLDQAWRDLVASVLSLEDQSLLQALVEWDPPAGLEGETARVAFRPDRALVLPVGEVAHE